MQRQSIGARALRRIWDVGCALSLIGIWPRYIEPNLLSVSKIRVVIPGLIPELRGFKILHLSDLHFSAKTSVRFLQKVLHAADVLQPDLVAFTGDFLCYALLEEEEQMKHFLTAFRAPYGCYAVLGNHDYEQYVGINAEGDYDVLEPTSSEIAKAFRRLYDRPVISGRLASRIEGGVRSHPGIKRLLKNSSFQLLDNDSRLLKVGRKGYLNICGLGEYSAGQMRIGTAFRKYDTRYPGLILVHNPDAAPKLADWPGELILCGHVHGGQLNLPWLVHRFSLMENPQYRAGLYSLGRRWMYVNRGLGGVMRLRFRAQPEVALLTLEASS